MCQPMPYPMSLDRFLFPVSSLRNVCQICLIRERVPPKTLVLLFAAMWLNLSLLPITRACVPLQESSRGLDRY